jgi:hypothetical protein
MTEQEFRRRADELTAIVDSAHASWMERPASRTHRERYEQALVRFVEDRQSLVNCFYLGNLRGQ